MRRRSIQISAVRLLSLSCSLMHLRRLSDGSLSAAETFNVVVVTFVACAAIGYAMCAIVSSVLESIVSTIFVCFAEVRAFFNCQSCSGDAWAADLRWILPVRFFLRTRRRSSRPIQRSTAASLTPGAG
jgi:hypothetical protein